MGIKEERRSAFNVGWWEKMGFSVAVKQGTQHSVILGVTGH
jgi:hypothetical protein